MASDMRRAYNPVGNGRSLRNTFILRAMAYDPVDKVRDPVKDVVLREDVRSKARGIPTPLPRHSCGIAADTLRLSGRVTLATMRPPCGHT